MKLTLPTAQLLEGIGHGAAVAAAKSPKPILECVVLRADKTTGLTIEATDLDVGLRVHVGDGDVDVVAEGSIVVPAARLLAIVREIDEDETELVEENGNLRVDSGRGVFRLRAEASEEFPQLPYFPDKPDFTIEADAFRGMVRRTAFAAAREAGRFALHGVLLTSDGGRLELVATDGRRLAKSSHALGGGPGKDVRAIIGPKALVLLERALGSAAEPQVEVSLEERQVLLRSGDVLVISRLIDGTFPAIDNVIPQKTAFELRAQVADLASGLRRASLLTTRDSLSVELMLDPESVTIRSRATEVGEAKVEVPVQYDGEPLRIGFNPVYLQDALKVMDPASEVVLGLNDAKSPGRMTDGDDYVYVISPIALE